MYVEGPPPLYISYASPEQTRQDRYKETLEAAGDKGQRINGRIVLYAKINNLCWMALITLISTSELPLVFLMTSTLDLNFVDIVGIRVEPLVHVPNIHKWQFTNQ